MGMEHVSMIQRSESLGSGSIGSKLLLVKNFLELVADGLKVHVLHHFVVPAAEVLIVLGQLCVEGARDLVQLASDRVVEPGLFVARQENLILQLIVESLKKLHLEFVEVDLKALLELFGLKIVELFRVDDLEGRAADQLTGDVAQVLEEVAVHGSKLHLLALVEESGASGWLLFQNPFVKEVTLRVDDLPILGEDGDVTGRAHVLILFLKVLAL
jgi:hypothetical protein|mmetsp:Transcript_18572/g.24991  ORF Transcript_18572/g.24991 Transcript_18572/m.24991 type:complete len:214 (-) Transcript_18572:201-842(-)|eukprot:CAMPEP_0185578124 /NCGR_PEP_ID=MMETSP0434-20130131/12104_1 /TAXON_ID=626734 ORGANISM="Favella taraikaensis, Strain Fe Narragansett Bay" /NCGR_SAMPLE_ID=MMETSP0434 /ASSEMBLY_ACC=CAM_ASM_000379 /LENGTH=213 /DNA_ID=CAMNT_0028195871 /DNA_START=74 /DNA_END=715 /DNA_ORIENTATION=+